MKSYAPAIQHCESCGAPRTPTKLACQYCGAEPTLTSSRMSLVCPHCLCRTADESMFCQSCGQSIQPATLDHRTGQLLCPRCLKPRLLNREIGAFQVDECGVCGGMWIGEGVFERIVNQQAREREEKVYSHEIRTCSPSATDTRITYIKCPLCEKFMNRRNFAHASGVIIDECKNDGIWLDRDELHKIAEYVASGGLRRSKEIELRRLEEQRKQIVQAGSSFTGPHPLFSDRTRDKDIELTEFGKALFDAVADFVHWIKS